jgi:biotin operon repressor
MAKRKQTKIDKVQALLRRPSGASLEALCKTTGWQSHSVRAALSGLRKKGVTIERRASDKPDGSSTYHLTVGTGEES